MSVSARMLVGTFAILCTILSVKQFLDPPPNQCHMTYMKSPAQYVRVELSPNASRAFPDYRLYVYGESDKAQQLAYSLTEGIPILFIHGNAGNYGQSRSLATILQLKDEMYNRFLSRFTVYTVDFNEEFSALYGGLLLRQSKFLHECIHAISKRYNQVHPNRVMKLIVVGHSQGGIIARSLYLNPDFDMSTIALHVELASPTRRPVLYFDRAFWEFYESVNGLWRQVSHVLPPVLSVMGGERDLQVRYNLGDSPTDLQVRADSVPHVWVTADHLCIAWCKQLQLTMSRALLDVAETIYDRQKIIKTLKFHFVRKYAIQRSLISLPKLAKSTGFSKDRKWIEMFEGSWKFDKKKIIDSTYLFIPMYNGLDVAITAFGLEHDEWLFGCTKVQKIGTAVSCLAGVDISRKNRLIPPLIRKSQGAMYESMGGGTGRVLQMTSDEIQSKKFEALVVYVPTLSENVLIFGERYSATKRPTISFKTNEVLSGFFSIKTLMTMHLSERTIYRKIDLVNMQHLWKAYTIKVHSKICMDGSNGVSFARFKNGWSHEEQFFRIPARSGSVTPFTLKLHSYPHHSESHNSTLEFYFDSSCAYDVHLQFDLRTSIGLLILHHGEALLSYCFAFALIVLARQLADIGKLGICFNFQDSLERSSSFVALTVIPTLVESLSFLPSIPEPLTPYLSRLPSNTSATESFVIRVILYWLASGLVYYSAKILELSLCLFSSLHIRYKKSSCSWSDPKAIPNASNSGISKSLTAFFVAILGVGMGVGGGIGVILGTVLHYIQVIRLACENRYLEDRKGPSAFSSRWKFQSTLFLTEVICLPIFIPSLIIWFHSWERLSSDPYLYTGPAIVILMIVLSQPDKPHPNRYYYRTTGYAIYLLAICSVVIAREMLFRLCYLELAVLAALCLQQHFKP